MITTFGSRLKELRMERGVRQDDLAELMGVMFGTVSKWERDIRKPDLPMLDKLFEEFKVPLGYLLGKDVPRTVDEPAEAEQCIWSVSDEDVTRTDFAISMAQLSEETRRIVYATINAAYKRDEAAGLLKPRDELSIQIRHELVREDSA